MLSRLARLAAQPRGSALASRVTLASVGRHGGPRRLLSTKGSSEIFDDKHLFPDQVLEEDKTGFPVGLPQIREHELWKVGAEETLVRT